LAIEVELKLSSTNLMTSDGHDVDLARDVRDAQSDHNDFIMNREVYCGKPVFGAGQ